MVPTSPSPALPLRIDAAPLEAAREAAVRLIAAGGLVALPSETVYGLCADARSDTAVARLYAAKGRPSTNPLIVHVADLAGAEAVAAFTEPARRLAAAFWPGPLTIVLPRRAEGGISDAACAGGPTIAVRVPEPALFRAVAGDVGAVVAPSANRSGRVSATSADAVVEELDGRIDLVVDGGPSPIGVESTVIDMTGAPRLLRPGAIAEDALSAVVGPLAGATVGAASDAGPTGPLRSPGLLASHYAPRARLRLDVAADEVRPDEAWLALGEATSPARPEWTYRLSPSSDLREAARRLYHGLRALDATGAAVIAVSPIPAIGIGAAIRDRLGRAAAPRPAPSELSTEPQKATR
ncbi:L-threonylcarbamoyladenylate synthase [Acuticoccus mangrovi]|uniref:Threonylcarbamoyl-AMP synthase n=1 Tax=Acuticoccus mangrovi TaxID=2796142 RepID=A0A934IM52_9HYPH|nr:L-threonylcarbamoyladenylate synthase [Acuticoccus mangrovi]MBJ3774893.1 threonylcarbamoyl-AMP synthase [Acuticoccus mangrovi]